MFISAKMLKIKYFLSAREWLNNFIRVPRKQISHGNLREVYSQKGYFKSIISMKAVIDFIFLGSKITADHNCSHEIKRHLLLERKAVILKLSCIFLVVERWYSRLSSLSHSTTHITFPSWNLWTTKARERASGSLSTPSSKLPLIISQSHL